MFRPDPVPTADIRTVGTLPVTSSVGVNRAHVSTRFGPSSVIITSDTYSHLIYRVGREAAGLAPKPR